MKIEKSPTSRATCVLCGKPIQKDEYRISQESQYYQLPSYYCYHLKCFFEFNPDNFYTLLEFFSEYLGDKEIVERMVKLYQLRLVSSKIGRKEDEC